MRYPNLFSRLLFFMAIPLFSIQPIMSQHLTRNGKIMGVQLQNAKESDDFSGVLIAGIYDNTPASRSDLTEGDIVTEVDGTPVRSIRDFMAQVRIFGLDDTFNLTVVNDKTERLVPIAYGELPPEQHQYASVIYDEVLVEDYYLRSIVTKPKTHAEKHPVVFYIQGYGCNVMDRPLDPENHIRKFVDYFSRLGYVTYRLEKSGVGDSGGEPCNETDFLTDAKGFLEGLKALKQYEFVDTSNIILFGHSMGGVWAPYVASQEKVKGIAVFGTVLRPWSEYMLENTRRQKLLEGFDYPEVERMTKLHADALNLLFVQRLTPLEIATQYPEHRKFMERLTTDDPAVMNEIFYKPYQFLQQVYDVNVSEFWKQSNCQVLAVWGRADYVSAREDHEMIAQLVNSYRPGTARYVEVDANHNFEFSTSYEDCYRQIHVLKRKLPFNESFLFYLGQWADEVTS